MFHLVAIALMILLRRSTHVPIGRSIEDCSSRSGRPSALKLTKRTQSPALWPGMKSWRNEPNDRAIGRRSRFEKTNPISNEETKPFPDSRSKAKPQAVLWRRLRVGALWPLFSRLILGEFSKIKRITLKHPKSLRLRRRCSLPKWAFAPPHDNLRMRLRQDTT